MLSVIILTVAFYFVMLNVITLSVVMLSVVAPQLKHEVKVIKGVLLINRHLMGMYYPVNRLDVIRYLQII
jgi:hypothetical protein